jgi:hypothetical protein
VIATSRLGLSALLILAACAADNPASEPELEEAQRLTYNRLTYNALTENALTANQAAQQVMVAVPLATSSYDGSVPELADQLHDQLTREAMGYLVGCALLPDQRVEYDDRFDKTHHQWDGHLGLCPTWADGPASVACQELVSACMLAHNNAFGRRVEISLRGHDEDGIALSLDPTEPDDFPWREGAFFGDLFSKLHSSIDIYVDDTGVVQGRGVQVFGSIYPNMWSCWSEVWNQPDAYQRDRVCAGGHSNCAAKPVGACQDSRFPAPRFQCALDDGLAIGDRDYQACSSPDARRWHHALTVFLADPCDLVGATHCDAY